MAVLIDNEAKIAYVPFSLAVLEQLREWSQPCQIRWAEGYETMEVRDMREPVKGVFITADDQLDTLPPPERSS